MEVYCTELSLNREVEDKEIRDRRFSDGDAYIERQTDKDKYM
jgi:hypothetical protein